jgi:hypothetical protein
LAKVAPERVMAGCGPLRGVIFSGVDPRRNEYFVDYETYAGAGGALPDQDGKDAIRVHVSGSANLPIESVEQEFPLTVGRYELIPDSGGPGKFRGGLGTRRDVTIWAERARLVGRGLRDTRGSPGLFGGRPGRTGRFYLHPDTDRTTKLSGSFSELPVDVGETIRIETPSGAGYGSPLERDPDNVFADVISGKVTVDGARRDYGVVISDGSVDTERTVAMRREMQERRGDRTITSFLDVGRVRGFHQSRHHFVYGGHETMGYHFRGDLINVHELVSFSSISILFSCVDMVKQASLSKTFYSALMGVSIANGGEIKASGTEQKQAAGVKGVRQAGAQSELFATPAATCAGSRVDALTGSD